MMRQSGSSMAFKCAPIKRKEWTSLPRGSLSALGPSVCPAESSSDFQISLPSLTKASEKGDSWCRPNVSSTVRFTSKLFANH
eukprot:4508889-Karenia_brevis.AAC.1